MSRKKSDGKYIAYALIFCMSLESIMCAIGMGGMATSVDQINTQVTPTDLISMPATFTDLRGLPATSTDLISMPATATDLRNLPATSTDLMGMPATATDLRSLPATSTDLISMPATATDLRNLPATSTDLISMPATATDLRSLPATSTDLISMPATATDLKNVPATSTDLVSMPVAATDLTDMPAITSDLTAAVPPMATASPAEENEINEAPIEQDYTGFKAGQIIRMGYYEQDGNPENFREPIEWKVISINKKKNVALVASVYALESMPYGTAGDETEYTRPGVNWKSSAIREWLNGEFYEKTFTEAEKKRIRQASNVTKDASGRFTTKDRVFLLSQIEAKRYYGTVEKLKCEATPYVMEKLGSDSAAIAKDGYCLWWVREMARAVKTNRQGEVVKNSRNEAGYVYGGKGLRMFLRKIGAKTYEENAALVRPAMWIKFDPIPKD